MKHVVFLIYKTGSLKENMKVISFIDTVIYLLARGLIRYF